MSRRNPKQGRRQGPPVQQIRYRRSGKCATTGKLCYPTALDAAVALGKAQAGRPVKGRDAKVEQRHYPCPHCKMHHLTSVA